MLNYSDSIGLPNYYKRHGAICFSGYTSGEYSSAYLIALNKNEYKLGLEDIPRNILENYYPDSIINNFVCKPYLDSIDTKYEKQVANKTRIDINSNIFQLCRDTLACTHKFRCYINSPILYRNSNYVLITFSSKYNSIVCVVKFNNDSEPIQFWHKKWQ